MPFETNQFLGLTKALIKNLFQIEFDSGKYLPPPPGDFYILQEGGDKIILESGAGDIRLEQSL